MYKGRGVCIHFFELVKITRYSIFYYISSIMPAVILQIKGEQNIKGKNPGPRLIVNILLYKILLPIIASF